MKVQFTKNELIRLINESLGKKTQIWKLPKSFMTGAAGICGALHLPLNKKRLQKLTENYVMSNEKIKSALGIEKMPVSDSELIRLNLFPVAGEIRRNNKNSEKEEKNTFHADERRKWRMVSRKFESS
jgi:hypothetical protein